jgi:hypothetical protein
LEGVFCIHLEGLVLFVDWYTADACNKFLYNIGHHVPINSVILQKAWLLYSYYFCAVAAKHKETKQFYTLYNTLDDKKLYLSKELTLLNSILDNYTE